jgi:hypothetical protein
VIAGAGIVAYPHLVTLSPCHLVNLQDFVEYWAAGRLNALGQNPYDPVTLHHQEQEASPNLTEAIMMWNPPWTLTVAMPFGLLPPRAGFVVWLLLQLAVVLGCVDWLWRYYGGPARFRWVAWAVSLGFAPTFFVLRMGQIGPLILLGITGFLYLEQRAGRRRYGWAGAVVVLAAIKPHLVYLFALAVLLWALERRRWSLLAGGTLALAILTAIPLACNPKVIQQYRYALSAYPPQFLCPTIGALLRLAFGMERLWLQFIPMIFGLGWFALHWLRHRRTWVWADQTPVLLLASFLTASYGVWSFDLVVLLVPLVQTAVGVWCSQRPGMAIFALITLLGFDAMALATMNVRYTDQYWHVWMTPMVLYSYLTLRRQWSAETPATPVLAEAG